MIGMVLFERTDTALTIGQLTWDYCTKVSDRSAVSVLGSALYNIGMGMYLIDNPNASEDTLFSVHVTSTPDKYSEGILSQSSDLLLETLEQLASQTYHTGVVLLPDVSYAGAPLMFYASTDYTDIPFVVSASFMSELQDPLTEVWFTMRQNPRSPNVLSVQGSIHSIEDRLCHVSLTAAQMNVAMGEYLWQLQFRRSIVTGTPPNQTTRIDKRMVLEGRAFVKVNFKS